MNSQMNTRSNTMKQSTMKQQPIIINCQVKGCHNKKNHVTSRHCCGACNMNGHGKVECGKADLKESLERYKYDVISVSCSIQGCLDPNTHTSEGHSCLYCDMRLTYDLSEVNHLRFCPLNKYTKSYDRHQIFDEKKIKELDEGFTREIRNLDVLNGTYTHTYGGMGSTWYVRRDKTGKKQYLIMHSDDWGQYGKEITHVPVLKSFKYGFNAL